MKHFLSVALLFVVHNTTFAKPSALSTITVLTQEKTALNQAQVLIGWAEGNPFAGNLVTTDEQGQFAIPSAWNQSLPVTIKKEGFITITHQNVLPSPQTLNIHHAEGNRYLRVQGDTNGFGQLRRDGKVDFGLVMPALDQNDLLNFDLANLISPESDVIKIIGRDVEIPSNLTLPQQTETYIFPIEFNKPSYRLVARDLGVKRYVAAHGQFPLQRVVNDFRAGKSFFEVINHFTFFSSGARDLEVKEGGAQGDIPVNEVRYAARLSITAPEIPAGKEVLAVALGEKDQLLFPTDLKRLTSRQRQELVTPEQNQGGFVLSLMTNAPEKKNAESTTLKKLFPDMITRNLIMDVFRPLAEDKGSGFGQLSFVLQSSQSLDVPNFIPHVAAPQIDTTKVVLQPPSVPAGVLPLATLVVYSRIENFRAENDIPAERRTRLWEHLSSGWVSEVALPQVAIETLSGENYRWEVLFLGQKASSRPEKYFIENVTHVSRNAVDVN